MRSAWVVLALCLAASSGRAYAAAQKCEGDEAYSVMDALDPHAPLEKRQATVDIITQLSEQPACAYERYLLGTLYRLGPQLAGNPLDKDSALANQLLEQYGLSGYAQAYADKAELALADGDAREAMRWTQVYLFLVTRGADVSDFDRSGYNADLLSRAQKAWYKARLPRSQVEAVLQEYLKPNRERLLEGMANRGKPAATTTSQATAKDDIKVKQRPASGKELVTRIKPGYAIFLLEIQPSGRVSRVVVESFAPTPEHAVVLRPLVEGYEFFPLSSEEPRVVRVPAQFGSTGHYAPNLKLGR